MKRVRGKLAYYDAEYEHGMARHLAKRVQFTGEIVTICKVDFECDGYYIDGRLNDLYVRLHGQDIYGCLAYRLQEKIDKELIRRMKSQAIIERCKEIEKELPTSKDPATLRLERSELEGDLEKLEATA